METIEEIGFGGLKIIQDSEGFRFGVDAIIIADFANRIYPDAKAYCDLGTGNGIIPAVLSHKNSGCSILGVDVQQKAVDLANRNAEGNGLADRISNICIDVKDIRAQRPDLAGSFDAVITNPPYVEAGSGLASADGVKQIARQETTAGLEEFISSAAWLIKDKGHFFIVYRPALQEVQAGAETHAFRDAARRRKAQHRHGSLRPRRRQRTDCHGGTGGTR